MAIKDVPGKLFLTHERMFADANLTQVDGYDKTTLNTNQVKIKASGVVAADAFGKSVAVGSGVVVVGAIADADAGSYTGSAYIYRLDGTQLAKIKASDATAGDRFGATVAAGSNRVVVGAYQDADNGSYTGSAYIYDLKGTQIAKIKPSDSAAFDSFAESVAVGCGRIVVGCIGKAVGAVTVAGAIYIFDLNGIQIAKISSSTPLYLSRFGCSVAIGCGRIVVGAYNDTSAVATSGAAYIFDLNGNQLAKFGASDGAAGDQFGRAVAVGSGRIVVGSAQDADNGSNSGSAYIFDLNGTQLAKIKASDGVTQDLFGTSVGVGSGRIIVGAYGDDDLGAYTGAAYLYDLAGTQLAKIKSSDIAAGDYFGRAVAAGDGKIVVGAYLDDDVGSLSGSAYIWTTPNATEVLDILD